MPKTLSVAEAQSARRDAYYRDNPEPCCGVVFENKPIIGFQGEHRWLSNFWPAQVTLDSQVYPTVEHAYQAAKTTNHEDRKMIAKLPTPGAAKRASANLEIRENWNDLKLSIMKELLRQKFKNPELRRKLCETHPRPIAEANTWGDTFWGCIQKNGRWIGHNHLGKLLMQLRREFCES